VDAWTFIWLMVFLKIPIVALFLLVRWAAQAPETEPSDDGGIGVGGAGVNPRHPRHPRPRDGRGPIIPRRGPHGEAMPAAPPRVRAVIARGRLIQR
jgi:hypothetical protein